MMLPQDSFTGRGAYQEQALPKASRRLVAAGQGMVQQKRDNLHLSTMGGSVVRFSTMDSHTLQKQMLGGGGGGDDNERLNLFNQSIRAGDDWSKMP